MAWKVRWTKPALEDLEQIADYIALDSAYYAAAFVRQMRDAARSLRQLQDEDASCPSFQTRLSASF